MKLYLSGPMSGVALNNFPAFNEAAAALRAQGHEVINPAELDTAADGPMTWADYLKRDIPELLKCDGIALLPGWQASKGARLEAHNALMLGMEMIYLKPAKPSELAEQVRAEVE